MFNPFTRFAVTCDWTCHRNRGSLGGVDWAMPVGTALPAPSAGVVTFLANNGTAGHTATVRRADGSRTQYMHLSAFVGKSGRTVKQGEIIGKSGGAKGAPGAGSSTGPHLHAHDITKLGARVRPFTTEAMTASPTSPSPIGSTENEEEMKSALIHYTGKDGHRVWGLFTPGTAYFLAWRSDSSDIASGFKAALDTGSSTKVTEGMYKAVQAAAARMATGTFKVDIEDADIEALSAGAAS